MSGHTEAIELVHFAKLYLADPCELYAFHMRELANSIYFATKDESYTITEKGREILGGGK